MQAFEPPTPSGTVPIRILVVCTANVCRSPLAAGRLTEVVAAAGLSDRIAIASAGTDAVAGAPQCPVSYRLGRSARGGEPELVAHHPASAHEAQVLDLAIISAHDLILTAERRHRSSAVSLDPSARDRTFTLREAVALARVAPVPPDDGDASARFAEWVRSLDALRGTVPDPPEWRRRDGSTLDIHDGHGLGGRRHRRALTEVEQAADEFAQRLVELFGAPGRP